MKMVYGERHAQYLQAETSLTFSKLRIRLVAFTITPLLRFTRLLVGLEVLESLAGPGSQFLFRTQLVITLFLLGIGTSPTTR